MSADMAADDTSITTTSSLDGTEDGNKSSTLSGFGSVNVLRQISMILALAICLAVAVFIIFWAKEPDYRPLGKMETAQMVQVLDVLDKHRVKYQIDLDVVKVPESEYQNVKMLLTREGIESLSPKEDYLSKDTGFGVSQRMEQARLKSSRELNLARAIEELTSISRAKVILALPKENVFARNRSKPSATVVLTTRRAGLDQGEVDAVVDIVASAVEGLEPSKVTVTDASGRLLNSGSQTGVSARARRELELVQHKEAEYRAKIDSILIPILGPEHFTSQVDVNLDFTAVEQTAKRYNPQLPSLRSEMTVENQSSSGSSAGIPGALTNQPPMKSDIPEVAGQNEKNNTSSGSSHKEATRNYELDTVISHTRQQIGTLRRVSVSVAVNYKSSQAGENGEATRVPRTDKELENIRRLLEGAIGFSSERGDVLEVVTVPFMDQLVEATQLNLELWQQPWFWRSIKLGLGSLIIMVLILVVVRPTLKRLINPEIIKQEEPTSNELAEIEDLYAADTMGMIKGAEAEYSYAEDGSIKIPNLHKDDDMIKAIRALVVNEPELSTQVVKHWLEDNG